MIINIEFPEGKHCNNWYWDKSKEDLRCPFFNTEWSTCNLLKQKLEWDEDEAEHLKLPDCPALAESK